MANPKIEVEIGAKINQFISDLNDAESSLQRFGTNAIKIGAAFTAAVSLPILALGNISLKAASDAQETSSKFAVVFRDIQEDAKKSFELLRNEYGLSTTAAKGLLAGTGDLLTGFGFSQKAALDLSTEVAKLGADLASFGNFAGGAEGATKALTSALLGERESVKALGISILEEDVKKQVAINTAKGMTFETERQAKAYATLDIALAQSKNAIGDVGRTMGDFANQQRIARARIEELSVSLGTVLLPIATKITGVVIKITDSLNLLSSETKTAIVVFAGLAFAIGPVLLGIGTAIKLMPVLIAGITAISGPVGILVIALTAATATIILNFDEVKKKVSLAVLEVIVALRTLLSAIDLVAGVFPGFKAITTGALAALQLAGESFAKSLVENFKGQAEPAVNDLSTNIVELKTDTQDLNSEAEKLVRTFTDLAKIPAIGLPRTGNLEALRARFEQLRSGGQTESTNGAPNLPGVQTGLTDQMIKSAEAGKQVLAKIYEDARAQAVEFNEMITQTLSNGISNAITDLAFSIGEALATGDNVFSAIGQSLLNSIGSFLGDLGAQLIQVGVAGLAFATLLKTIEAGGPAAIPAAIAAIGIGFALTAASGAFKGLAGKGLSGSSGSSSVGSGVSSQSYGGSGMSSSQLDLTGQFTVRGQDLVYIMNSVMAKNDKG